MDLYIHLRKKNKAKKKIKFCIQKNMLINFIESIAMHWMAGSREEQEIGMWNHFAQILFSFRFKMVFLEFSLPFAVQCNSFLLFFSSVELLKHLAECANKCKWTRWTFYLNLWSVNHTEPIDTADTLLFIYLFLYVHFTLFFS